LTTLFPTPDALAEATGPQLTSLGLTTRRAETIQAIARLFADQPFRIEPGTDPDRVRATLLALPGVGEWTVEYLLLRAAGWPDAFPSGDLGLQKAAGFNAAELEERAEKWRPWRGHAAMLLWRSLNRTD
jgi:AraC family transcriptional regulator of adaptative response / DNA-3-methyladenine glycosylase II